MKFFWMSFFILFIGKIYGQDNFKRGYIIANNKDTIIGWIDFRTDAQNMSVCKFKVDETAKPISYMPGEIYGYRFYQEGKFFISREITINNLPRIVFLEYMVKGIMNLYYYVDSPDFGVDVDYFFFEDEAGKMTPVPKKQDEYINDKKHVDRRYIGMIKYLFKEQETISKEADKLKFSQKSMINIAKEYHNQVCTTGEECIVFETKEDKAYNLCKFSVYGGVQSYFEEYVNVISPTIGGRLNVSIPRWKKKLSFQADLSISKIHGTVTFNEGNSPMFNEGWCYLSSWETDNIFVPLLLGGKYSFGNHRLCPTIGGGFAVTSFFRSNQRYYYTYLRTEGNFFFDDYFGFGTFVLFYSSLGLEYTLNNKSSIFIDAECIAPVVLQLKLGYTF